jgi:hypothetical protein
MATQQTQVAKTVANYTGLAPTMGADDTKAFTFAQEVFAAIKQSQGVFTGLVHRLWDMNVDTRKRIQVHLGNFIKEAKANAGAGAKVKGMDPHKWGQVARSATVRASHLNVIVRAMIGNDATGQMGKAWVAKAAGCPVADVENMSIDTLVQLARIFNGGKADAGRTPDDAPTKVAKFLRRELANEKATEKDVRFFKKCMKVLEAAGIELPDLDAEAKAKEESVVIAKQAVTGKPAKAKTPRVVKAKTTEVPVERREENKPLPTGISEDRRVH